MSDNDELRRLKAENRKLKKRLHDLEKKSKSQGSPTMGNTDCYSESNYFSYLFSRIKAKSLYASAKRVLKPSIWVTRIFSWLLIIYKYIQAGAFVILYTAAFILIVPILIVTTAITLGATLIMRKRNADTLLEKLCGDVIFIIPDGKDAFDSDTLMKKCDEHREKTVLIVSPFFFDKVGIYEGKKAYVCYRKECENVYILRTYFFFYFRKRLQKAYDRSVSETIVYKDKEV